MGARPPSPEQLVDLAWLLDSALILRQRGRALETADRLLEALLDHDDAILARRRQLDASTACALQQECIELSRDVVTLLRQLRLGTLREPIEFRQRMERLVDDEALAWGSPASS
jgi:predicted secreted protein